MKSKYFSNEDIACHCGCGFNDANPILLKKMDELCVRIGKVPEVSCMCRCPDHNFEVGGVRNSQHTKGNACDIIVPDDMTVDGLADIAIEIGFDGIGRYYEEYFVHVDVRDDGDSPNGYQWTDDD